MRTRHLLIWLALFFLLLLTGCGGGHGSDAPLPTVVLGAPSAPTPTMSQPGAQRASTGVVASAEIVPARDAELAWGVAGRVAAVHVDEGDRVEAGQVLLSLDDRAIQAQLGGTRAALAVAQAQHDLLAAGPTDEALRQAQAGLDVALAALRALEAGPRPENVAQAEANLASAQAALALLQSPPTALELESARLNIDLAKDSRWAAQGQRDYVCGSGSLKESQCDAAKAQVLMAEVVVRQAENQLAQIQQSADQESITQAQQAVRVAEAQLALAQQPATAHDLSAAKAQVEGALAALDALKAGPRPEQLDALLAQVASAQAQVEGAQALLDTLDLSAPFDGTVTDLAVHSGQWMIPGQVAATLADLGALVVETTDLSELDVPHIAVGQSAMVTVEALAQDVSGRVSAIAPLADILGGDVVYRVTVTLDEQPEGLRAGMSADVAF